MYVNRAAKAAKKVHHCRSSLWCVAEIDLVYIASFLLRDVCTFCDPGKILGFNLIPHILWIGIQHWEMRPLSFYIWLEVLNEGGSGTFCQRFWNNLTDSSMNKLGNTVNQDCWVLMCNVMADFVRKPGQLQSRRLFSLQLSEPYPVTEGGEREIKKCRL